MNNRSVISDEAIEMAFTYLNEQSEQIGIARANLIRAEYKAKRVFARLFMVASGSVDSKKMWATDNDEYAAAVENIAVATQCWETMSDQKNRAELIIKAWQTAEASGRALRSIR